MPLISSMPKEIMEKTMALVFLPTDRGAWRGYSPWGLKELEMTEQLKKKKKTKRLRIYYQV